MYGVFVFCLGILIGSFLNVCIYRIPRGESIVFPPSHCTNCGNRIAWYDLIPIISYIFLRGRCRFCGTKISLKYPVIEFITGCGFYMIFYNYGFGFYFLKYSALLCLLIVIGIIDYQTMDVYFKTVVFGFILSIIFILIGNYFNLEIVDYVYGGALGGGLISLIILLTKGMGWGDAEICLICGLFLGLKNTIIMLFFSFVFGGFISIILIVLKIKSRKDYVPFGPFIALSSIFTIFFAERILNWYLSIL